MSFENGKPAALDTRTGLEISCLAAPENSNFSPVISTPQARWSDRNPKARWAHSALRSALKRGLIAKEPCERCGATEVDGHHEDYDRPMVVRWLCRKDHKQEHARLNALKCEAAE